jgi:hypothetical protein
VNKSTRIDAVEEENLNSSFCMLDCAGGQPLVDSLSFASGGLPMKELLL